MKIIQSITTNNPCYKTGQKMTVKGLMLHSVGCSQPSAKVFVNLWNSGKYEIGVHGVIDGNTGDVYQCLPWNHLGWHGGGTSNYSYIGVEMCEPACIKYTGGSTFTCSDLATARAVAQRTYNSAVELFAHLCKEYKLDPMKDGVIVSHKEGHKRGIASNHGDPEHLWKGLGLAYTMDGFRKAVQAQMKQGGTTTTPTAEKPVSNVQKAPYMVNIPAKTDVYSAPAVMQIQKKGVYTIVEEKNGFGKLKSGAGWIKLSECTKY